VIGWIASLGEDAMKITVVLANDERREHDLPQGGWIVDDSGVLHVRDANHNPRASYAPGRWVEVR
jgi:hypothetical protein